MFTPEELEFMPRGIEKLFSDLEWRIMMDIVRRLQSAGEITRTADWQAYRLSELGKSKAEIKKFIKEIMSMTDKEIDKVYEEALATGYVRDKRLYEAMGKDIIPYAENMVLQQMVKAIKNQTREELKNITQSMGFAKVVNGKIEFTELADFYQKTLDDAVMDITSGAFDYNSVLKRTIDTMANSGLRTVDYASGHHNRVEVAARRALMTGVSQLTGKITEQNAEKLGTEWFEVTRHTGARPDHQVWQGKCFTLEQLRTICGYGEVTGLKGANCRHDFDPFIPGIDERKYTDEELERLNEEENTPKEWNGKEYTAYEANQKQRRMETTIRAQKRKIKLLEEGEADADTITAARCRWRKKMSDYAEFSDVMKLPQQRERFYIGKEAKKRTGLAAGEGTSKDYRVINALPFQKVKQQKVLKNIVEEMPQKMQEALSDTKVVLDSPKGNCYYDDIDTMHLSKNYAPVEVWHESGHAIEHKLIDESELNAIKQSYVEGLDINDIYAAVGEDAYGNKKDIFVVKSSKFLELYQSRIYADSLEGCLDSSGRIDVSKMYEFVSVALEWYYSNPIQLSSKQAELFELLERVLK